MCVTKGTIADWVDVHQHVGSPEGRRSVHVLAAASCVFGAPQVQPPVVE
jgi:hypothetical protein